ncbi:bifunctional glycosyltransferase family 2/GtrA family protein [Rhodopseudomonas palustris]|uniref:Bifunctional glycosyltransferase family 2/GtrA family protein n=1 Tax=Rhodopseudomonas palustris TaxID=1076 RepID=A0AAX3DV25_RHOPL|nr:bifunctional glycosyltransferase family 2/GtrA family protein [Rhodopseudomonas palustris]UYO38425.1 bifunctional glycosyltransferase family 2/GtrA family protein [Rhodopseudomonas palustris]
MPIASVIILIPAYKPTKQLPGFVRSLTSQVDCPVVVVDDGCGLEYRDLFAELAAIDRIQVIRNAANLGKGAALKNGLNYILVNHPNCVGVVTADADGQHAISDIAAVCQKLHDNPNALIMGCRTFGSSTPLRSRFGNAVSRVLYRYLLGVKLSDTQTGLRGLPRKLALASLNIRSNRYEFESEQLTLPSSLAVPIQEIPIQTIYEDNNASSHFDPLMDSARIYFVVLRYGAASIVTALIDLMVFLSLVSISIDIIPANLGSRAVALCFQFLMLRSVVFKTGGGLLKFGLFVGYVAFTGLVSGVLQEALTEFAKVPVVASKVLIDTTIFIFNFLFLRDIMFASKKTEGADT